MGIAANPPLVNQCAGLTPADLLITKRPSLYEVGRTTAPLYQDSTVTIQNVYNPNFAFDLMSQYAGTLVLDQGYAGTNPFGGINTLAGGLPPSGMTDLTTVPTSPIGQAFVKLQNPALTTAGLVQAVQPPGTGNLFARLDFAISLGSIDITQYHSFRVNGLVGGGVSDFTGGICGAPTANSRVDVAVYAPYDFPPWSTPTSSTSTTSAALPTLEVPFTYVQVGGQQKPEFLDTFNGVKFIHIAMLSTDAATGAFCSNIRVDQLQITLVP
jgi:hypothetical protein